MAMAPPVRTGRCAATPPRTPPGWGMPRWWRLSPSSSTSTRPGTCHDRRRGAGSTGLLDRARCRRRRRAVGPHRRPPDPLVDVMRNDDIPGLGPGVLLLAGLGGLALTVLVIVAIRWLA